MNLGQIDLNLLVYLDVLLREKNVTKAAEHLGITQPAMSNGLRRLRELLGDPVLVRSSQGMAPTERALEMQPRLRQILADLQLVLDPGLDFEPFNSHRVFRIMASDYAEATLVPRLTKILRELAPELVLDFLTPSDVSYRDMEQGKVDIAINRFNEIPQSFHQITVWNDSFSCLISHTNPVLENFNLESYLAAQHIWVSKTGMGVGFGVNPDKTGGLGWIDQALEQRGEKRKISIFTRHYQMPALIAESNDLVATLPTRVAQLQESNPKLVILPPPFEIPDFELKMAWSPLLQHSLAHKWLRGLIVKVADDIVAGDENAVSKPRL